MYIVSVQTLYDEFTKMVDMSYVNAAIGDVLKVAPKGAVNNCGREHHQPRKHR